jgi:clan AA aspartic protease (TIGR02281 family)
LVRYAEDPVFLVLLGEVRFDQGAWMEGVVALAQAYELEPSERVESLLERGYLELVQEAVGAGDVLAQETSLLQGIQQLPDSGILHLELAKLYIPFQAYDDAIRLLRQARELDSSLRDSVENLLAKIDDAIKRRDAVIVRIPAGSRSIRTEAVIDGHTASNFIIDTGATYTSIPSGLAHSLGYDTSPSKASRVTISGVGGIFNVPLIRVQSLDLGGYTVRNLDVLVISEKIGPNVGLLGLNFLKHFKYSVDPKRQEFRLERL